MKTAEETLRELEKTIKAQEVVILKNDKLIAEQEVIYRQVMSDLQNKVLPWSVQTNKPSQPLHSCIIKSVDFRHLSELN